MSVVIVESLSGLVRGLVSGTIAFFTVMLLSIVYKYFTDEKLSSFIGIVFGLRLFGIFRRATSNSGATHFGRRNRSRGSIYYDSLGC